MKTIKSTGYFPITSSFVRLLTCAVIFVTLVDQSEKTTGQRKRIVNIIDHLLINKKPDEDLKSAVVTFRALMQDRPITFNMADFVNVNYSFLVSLTSVLVTYTIILLQNVN
ncbi:unnamed protein product [Arctia plantaginis]|uniref:Gustatory receptor n=1 Tax=Arctia plantaginis TaxID=874455 RepID=A0A8S1BS08_ARCPL|nr:unnamed protein product [Arctia plantaginis]CAB3261599.1 unnamed protein product [Arctia plantaginis]